jgi:diaminohydroxyphosphoribosylaminopyrimidine deaminase/5-amino-6-(5-phosphoribosylamino)uracil reductase
LITAGVRRVFYGTVDPNPRVAGQGLERLRSAGIEVFASALADDCRRLIAPFAKHVKTGRPYVILKAAMTIDGQLATSSGESQWISGEKSRELVQHWRDRVDGILTGSGTVLTDNPRLTVRLPDCKRNPARIVLDSRVRTLPAANVYSPDVPGRRLLVTAEGTENDRLEPFLRLGTEIIAIPKAGDHLDLAAVMTALGRSNLHSLLVEGGGALNGALLRAGTVDRVMLFVAPLLFGGNDGRGLFSGKGAARLAEALRLNDLQVSRIGEDLLLEGEVARCSQG